ncbi:MULTISPECIES: MFS transporter [Streptomycetaceae]|uniref:Putative proline/betaine transporter n=1 Tax=Streptantibioticus cattleyicolor (strain ATCC 35852 / DSM 46488 / JCM 4925 / NBRC 14057 / NRRL 8057) TaxID=1003195 RepID=F8JW58_STREN|nr:MULTISPECIES: MFS transporter [Streptomycetaceae]AEW93228.1 transmembrane transport protein [Streptantibioticus cattleyicolor NRRL 8057 = DSM 46488]MYS57952.1 MFS transporter [Streptomyces sp. SID5468]CCB73591.1 putative transmembrane transport protein [Streptantibioticus cattleyicolor NRRL 8057 = DSM 46488]
MTGSAPIAQSRPAASPARLPVRQLAAASVGNAVEWYDWYAYSFLAVYFAGQIFPKGAGNSLVPLLSTFAVFAVGFFMRPVGGLLMGAVADRLGRRAALSVTIVLMGGGSLLVAVTPTYTSAGVLGPVVLVVARLLQGLSVGGEFAASTTFLVESAGPGRRGLFSSFQYVSTTAGQLVASGLAALLAQVLTDAQMTSWGWRVAFAVGAVISLVGLWIRRGAVETRSEEQQRAPRPGLFEALRRHPRQSLLICGITVGGTIAYYTWTTYLPTYATVHAGLGKGDALTAGTITLAFFAVLQPLGGMLSDRIGRKPLLIGFAVGFAVLVVPLLHLLTGSLLSLVLVGCAGMVLLTGYTSVAAAVNAEVFPARVRAAGIGFPYSLTVAVFGGTAPYVGTWFQQAGHAEWFPWYVAVLCLVSAAVYVVLPETAGRPLDR